MSKFKGLKTILVNAALFASYVLGWDQITQYVSAEKVAEATVFVNMILRVFTNSPVGKQG